MKTITCSENTHIYDVYNSSTVERLFLQNVDDVDCGVRKLRHFNQKSMGSL